MMLRVPRHGLAIAAMLFMAAPASAQEPLPMPSQKPDGMASPIVNDHHLQPHESNLRALDAQQLPTKRQRWLPSMEESQQQLSPATKQLLGEQPRESKKPIAGMKKKPVAGKTKTSQTLSPATRQLLGE
jgi:hypothetical protein